MNQLDLMFLEEFLRWPNYNLLSIRAETVKFLNDNDSRRLRCCARRLKRSSTTYWLEQAREQLEYEILYQPDFSEDTQDSE